MNKAVWILTVLAAGAFLPIQAGLNAKLGRAITSPVYASMVSFVIGALAIGAYILVSRETANFPSVRGIPGYAWLGGVMGAFYVTSVILAFPKLGPALTFGLVVAGQMLLSIVLDHFGILITEPHPINAWRVLGVVLIISGVIILRIF